MDALIGRQPRRIRRRRSGRILDVLFQAKGIYFRFILKIDIHWRWSIFYLHYFIYTFSGLHVKCQWNYESKIQECLWVSTVVNKRAVVYSLHHPKITCFMFRYKSCCLEHRLDRNTGDRESRNRIQWCIFNNVYSESTLVHLQGGPKNFAPFFIDEIIVITLSTIHQASQFLADTHTTGNLQQEDI